MLRNRRIISDIRRLIRVGQRRMCSSKDGDSSNKTDEIKTDPDMPEEPTNCCMSGCEKCVWKQYANELISTYNHSGADARKIILEKIKDPSMQVFLKMELEFLEDNKN